MNNNTYEFRPTRIGTFASIIGMFILRGFEELGQGIYAPVYKPDEKFELNRLNAHGYDEEVIKDVMSVAQKSLESLVSAGCKFTVKLIERYKSGADKDLFGKHSNNYLAEVLYYPIDDVDQDTGDMRYKSPESFNDYIIKLFKDASKSSK